MKRSQSVPVQILLNETDSDPTGTHPLLRQAEVIYAVKEAPEGDILIFGKEKMARIASSDCPEGARVLRVALSSERQDFHRLLQLVHREKGAVDYAEPA
jgi:hypothetical protein